MIDHLHWGRIQLDLAPRDGLIRPRSAVRAVVIARRVHEHAEVGSIALQGVFQHQAQVKALGYQPYKLLVAMQASPSTI